MCMSVCVCARVCTIPFLCISPPLQPSTRRSAKVSLVYSREVSLQKNLKQQLTIKSFCLILSVLFVCFLKKIKLDAQLQVLEMFSDVINFNDA